MVSWKCPECKGEMYSSCSKENEKTVICIYCKCEYQNQYCRSRGGENENRADTKP